MNKRSKRKSPRPKHHSNKHHHVPKHRNTQPRIRRRGDDLTLPASLRRQFISVDELTDEMSDDSAA